ncbi:hypothetical protein FSP39_023055 [Pinctada imbricata]|uniref:Complex III subunit 9 n=1 Tax=Pinctada imbricata TaxID=66713 RepID=A0AA89BWE7_PINIB|nr:hypothetical protein FSP39_023055 [Pinctada imbricata]
MSFFSNIYRMGIRRTSSYILLLFGAGVGYEVVCDKGVDRLFEYVNAGVSNLA